MDDRTSWELRASVAMEKDEMATTQLESLDTNDKGWTYRLDQARSNQKVSQDFVSSCVQLCVYLVESA